MGGRGSLRGDRAWPGGKRVAGGPDVHIFGSQNVYSREEGIADHYWPWAVFIKILKFRQGSGPLGDGRDGRTHFRTFARSDGRTEIPPSVL